MSENPNFNFIYEKMVDEPDNIVGLVAYGIYKRHKIEHVRKFLDEHGRAPTREDLASFHEVSCGHINGYTLEAVDLFNDFANNLLAEKIEELEENYRAGIREVKEKYSRRLAKKVGESTSNIDTVIKEHNGWWKKIGSGVAITFIVTAINLILLFSTLLSQKTYTDIWTFLNS